MLTRICHPLRKSFCSLTVEPLLEPYLNIRTDQFRKFMALKPVQHSLGHYTVEGAARFAARHPSIPMKKLISNNKQSISQIGVGSYRGSLNEDDDILQFNAVVDSVMLGVNAIDTCSNFRGGRSELVIGVALDYLRQVKKYDREELCIASKVGYVRETIPSDLASEVVNNHCVHPLYLEGSLKKSLQNLRLQSLDVFYINNFAESQLKQLGRDKFMDKLHRVFEFCEKARRQHKIQYYGLASWESFRLPPNHPLHLNLKIISDVAKKVGGASNGFKFVQTPINIMMPEAFAQKNQQSGSLLQTAEAQKINIVSCSPLLSGTLINIQLPTDKLYCRNNGAKHLQLIRSIPSPALVNTLIGQKTNRHVKKNLEVFTNPSLTEDQWFAVFVPQAEPNSIQA